MPYFLQAFENLKVLDGFGLNSFLCAHPHYDFCLSGCLCDWIGARDFQRVRANDLTLITIRDPWNSEVCFRFCLVLFMPKWCQKCYSHTEEHKLQETLIVFTERVLQSVCLPSPSWLRCWCHVVICHANTPLWLWHFLLLWLHFVVISSIIFSLYFACCFPHYFLLCDNIIALA